MKQRSNRKPPRATRHSATLYEFGKFPPLTPEQRRRNEEIALAELATPRKVAPCFIGPDEPFRCSCGAEQPSPSSYAAAHWNDELVRTCSGCGADLVLFRGHVRVKRRT